MLPKPSSRELAALAETLGLELDAETIRTFEGLASEFLKAYERVDALADEPVPEMPGEARAAIAPTAEDDPFSAFLVRCLIERAGSGPLSGRTVAVKDSIQVAGLPVLNGSPLLEGWIPREDATVVRRLLEAGASIIGKTKVPAFCFDGAGITCYPEPQPRNPYAPDHLPGGSSSGSAVAVASGAVELALGTDTGGSIRMPASWSGCCGLKPTYGLVPYTGVLALERTFDHVGPLASSVKGCALLLTMLAGPDGLDARAHETPRGCYIEALKNGVDGMTIGVLAEGFGLPEISEPGVDAAVLNAAALLERAGARVAEVSIPLHRDGPAIWSAVAIQGSAYQMLQSDGVGSNHRGRYSPDFADFFGRSRRQRAAELPDTVKFSLLLAEHISRVGTHRYYAQAQNLALALREAYGSALERCDVLILPTTPMKAMRRPKKPSVEDTIRIAFGVLHNTAPFNVSGHPAMSVPCQLVDGLPVGLMIVGRMLAEEAVLRVAAAFEQERGAFPPPPQVSA